MQEILLWWWSGFISVSEEAFFCSFITATSHVLAFSTIIFYFIYILTLPTFLSTSSFIQILPCSCFIICNLYCKLYIFMLRWCWVSLTILYWWSFPCSYSSTYRCLFRLFSFFFFKWNPSGSSKIALHGRSMFLCRNFFFVPSWFFSGYTSYTNCTPLSYKFHFPSKTSAFLCLRALCSFSLELCHLCEVCEVVLDMHLCLFCSYSLLSFFRFTCSYTVSSGTVLWAAVSKNQLIYVVFPGRILFVC